MFFEKSRVRRGCRGAALHTYLYAHGNPVMLFDPSGNSPLLEAINTFALPAPVNPQAETARSGHEREIPVGYRR